MNSLFYLVNYSWRVFATGLSFLFFGFGSLVLSCVILPFIQGTTFDKNKKSLRAQYAIHLTFKMFVFILKIFGLAEFGFKNFNLLENDRGCLIVSNHPTLIDYVMIISKIKLCNAVVKEGLFKNFFVGKTVRMAGYIPGTHSIETFEQIKSSTLKGDNILIFPEGTRTTPGQEIQLQRGTANLAIRANIPIRLIRINCTTSSLTKESKWYKVPKSKIKFWIAVGEKINSTEFLKAAGSPSLAARHLTEYLKKELEQEIRND